MLMLIGEYLLGVCMLAFCLPLIPNREGEWPAVRGHHAGRCRT